MPYEKISLPQYPCAEDMWDGLKKETRPIVIYGMGNGADKLIARFSMLGIEFADIFASDGFVRGHSFHGVRVKTLDEILFVMRHIRDEIWTRRTPTEVIFASVCSPRLSQLGFYEILKKEKDLYTAANICGIKGEELAFIKEFSEPYLKTGERKYLCRRPCFHDQGFLSET